MDNLSNSTFMHNFTSDDLVEFLYHETTPAKEAAIKAALETDWALREAFENLVLTQKQLETVQFSPREEVINRLLRHAEKVASEVHHH